MNATKLAIDAMNRGPDGRDDRMVSATLEDLSRYVGTVVELQGRDASRGSLLVEDTVERRREVSGRLADHHERLSHPSIRDVGKLGYYRRSLETVGGALERGEKTLSDVRGTLMGIGDDAAIGFSPRVVSAAKGPSKMDPELAHAIGRGTGAGR